MTTWRSAAPDGSRFSKWIFFSLSLSPFSDASPPPPLSLCLTLPRETRSVRRLAAGLKGSRYSVAESTPVCQFYPQEIRVFVPSSTPPRSFPALVLSSFSPAPLFMLPVNRENGHPSLFLHLLPLSLPFFLPSFHPPPLPLGFSERVARLTSHV